MLVCSMVLLSPSLQICNLTILQARMEAQPYYARGINSGPPLLQEEEAENEKSERREDGSDAGFDVSAVSFEVRC